jgi:cbb3-type cytochrome c oxidase subunit I
MSEPSEQLHRTEHGGEDDAHLSALFSSEDLPDTQGSRLVFSSLVRAHVYAGIILLLCVALFGLVTALKFVEPGFLGHTEYFTWGRTRYNHVQGVIFAWLLNGLFAFCYFAIPSLTGRALPSRRLGWVLFWLWNGGVVMLGWIGVSLGYSQPLEWHEFPWPADVMVVICWLGFLYQFLQPYWRRPHKPLYVSSWYIILAFVFTPFAYVMGVLAPYTIPGIGGAAFSGLWIHDAVGVLVTPLALAIAYYVIPVVTGLPIYSHFLSMVGFWGLAFFYPLNGTHHYIFSPIPVAAQNVAIVSSVFMGFVVLIVVINLLLSLKGHGDKVVTDPGLRWVWSGIIFYLLVSIEGAMQATAPLQTLIHFTDWIVAHAHFALAGFASFIILGGIVNFWDKVAQGPIPSRLSNLSFWLFFTGMMLMVVDLTYAGLVQANLWIQGEPWIHSVSASSTPWMIRFWSGLLMVAGFMVFLWSLIQARHSSKPTTVKAGLSHD